MSIRQDKIQLSIEINGTKAGSTFRELRSSARDLTRELEKLKPGTQEFIDKAEELKKVNNVLATIRKETAGVGQGTNALTNIWKQGVVASIAFFSTQRIIEWGKQFVSWAIKGTIALEDMRDKSRAVFRDSIDIVEDFAAINAQALGVTEEKYVSLASQIGAMLVPMGFAREEIAEMSADTLNLAGALSEWSGGTLTAEQTQQILGKAILGQTKGLKQLGIAISEADIKNRLAAEGNDKLTGTALKQAKAQATLVLIQEQSADAQREFANSQEDLGRSANRLSSVFAQLQENFLSKLLPGLKALSGSIADSISPLQRQSDLVEKSKDQFNVLIKTLLDGNLTYQGRLDVIKRINTEYKDYLPSLITEKTSNEELQKVLVDVNAQMEQRIDNLIKEEKLTDAKRRVDAAETAKNLAANRLAEQDRIKAKLAAQRASGENGGLGGLDQGQAERNNTALLTEARRQLNEANLELVTSEIHLQSVRINSGGLNVDEVLGRDAAAEAAKAALAAKNAAEEQRILDEQQAEKEKQERERRLNARLKSIEDFHNKERQIRIQATEVLRDDEVAYNAERERINLETDIKIARDQAALYKQGTTENLKLLQDALDKEAALRKQAHELEFKQRNELINREAELTKLHLREEIEDRDELNRKLDISDLTRVQKLAVVKLAGLTDADSEYVGLYNEITDRQLLIDQKLLEDRVAIKADEIELSHQLAIQGINDLQLEEEEFQKYREFIDNEYTIKILENRLALYKEGEAEFIAIENQIADKRRQQASGGTFLVPVKDTGEYSTPQDRDKELELRAEIEQAAFDLTEQFIGDTLALKEQAIEDELNSRLEAISTLEQANLEAAEGDAALQKKIRSEADKQRLVAEKQAAKERQAIAVKEAVIQGALAFIKSLPNYVAAAAAAAAAIFQITQIKAQKFDKGGFTGGRGYYRDDSGHEVAGVVHVDEYVVPKKVLEDPSARPHVQFLERVRKAKGGYVDGGFTGLNTRPVLPSSSTGTGGEAIDPKLLYQVIDELKEIKRVVAAWPKDVRANVVLTDLEKKSAELNYIRDQSVV